MTTITIKVTPEQKALYLAGELGLANEAMKVLRRKFPARSNCDNQNDDGRVCRERIDVDPDDYCERCELTEELSRDWAELRKRKYSAIQKLSKLAASCHSKSIGTIEPPFKHSISQSDCVAQGERPDPDSDIPF